MDNSDKPVLDVVSSTMREIVFSSDKDTFILFYKPDCQHCKDFMQTWMELGEALKVWLLDGKLRLYLVTETFMFHQYIVHEPQFMTVV